MNKAKRLSAVISLLIYIVIIIACGKQPEPDWNINFVVFDGNLYEVSNQNVEHVDKRIGRIEKRINDGAIHSGTISNEYARGTLLYEITNVDVKDAIAVEASPGQYLQANYKSKYGK